MVSPLIAARGRNGRRNQPDFAFRNAMPEKEGWDSCEAQARVICEQCRCPTDPFEGANCKTSEPSVVRDCSNESQITYQMWYNRFMNPRKRPISSSGNACSGLSPACRPVWRGRAFLSLGGNNKKCLKTYIGVKRENLCGVLDFVSKEAITAYRKPIASACDILSVGSPQASCILPRSLSIPPLTRTTTMVEPQYTPVEEIEGVRLAQPFVSRFASLIAVL